MSLGIVTSIGWSWSCWASCTRAQNGQHITVITSFGIDPEMSYLFLICTRKYTVRNKFAGGIVYNKPKNNKNTENKTRKIFTY